MWCKPNCAAATFWGRLGGEEFGVLVTADHLTALDIARAPARRDRGDPWCAITPQIDFTASLGVASMDAQTDTRDAFDLHWPMRGFMLPRRAGATAFRGPKR